jgi:hypothetical protein
VTLIEIFREDRRSERRVEAAIPIRVGGRDASGRGYDDSTTSLEVSRRGLSFLTNCNLAVFAVLTVVIPGRGPVRSSMGLTDFFAQATVVQAVKEHEQIYRVGIRFMGATLPMYCAESR